jgi:hypothetical protein
LDPLKRHRVTGFEAAPAKVTYSKAARARPPDLFELVITGWGGFAAAAAGIGVVDACPGCGYRSYSIAEPSRLIDAAAWDGSDLFVIWPLPGYYFASDRLVNILRQEKVSGVKAFPAEALPMERGDRATPGPLAWSMPEHRTRELEQRYGTVIS